MQRLQKADQCRDFQPGRGLPISRHVAAALEHLAGSFDLRSSATRLNRVAGPPLSSDTIQGMAVFCTALIERPPHLAELMAWPCGDTLPVWDHRSRHPCGGSTELWMQGELGPPRRWPLCTIPKQQPGRRYQLFSPLRHKTAGRAKLQCPRMVRLGSAEFPSMAANRPKPHISTGRKSPAWEPYE